MKKIFSRMSKTIAGVAFLFIAFSSCENFMKGSEVREEISEAIKYNNTASCTIILKSDAAMGSFLAQKEDVKVGYPIEIQFELNSEAYSFEGLEAVSQSDMTTPLTSYVEFEKKEIKNNYYKYKLTVLKESNDILIRPVCKLLPAVSEFYPPFVPDGYDQDTTIKITFNKAVDVQSFADILNFSKLKIYSGGENLASYYQTPYFSEDNKTLYVPTVKGKNILNVTQNLNKDIEFDFDWTGAKDVDGMNIADSQSVHTYTIRINSKIDSIPPVLSACHVFSNSDPTSWNYRELTELPCEEWTTTATEQFPHGNFSQNHVSKIFIQMDGYDNGGGIAKLCVRETKIRDASNWAEVSDEYRPIPVETAYDLTKLNISDTNDNKNKTYSINHQFTDMWDGVSLIEIWFQDYSGLKSDIKRYNIINKNEQMTVLFEASINSSKIINYSAVHNEENDSYELGLQFNEFQQIVFPHASYKNENDYYPTNLYSKANFIIEFFDNEESVYKISNIHYNNQNVAFIKDTINELVADYRFNVDHTNVMKIKVENESGNIYELNCEIPKIPQISYIYDDNSRIIVSDEDYKEKKECYSTSVTFLYTYQADENSEPSEIKKLNLADFNSMDNGIYNLYACRQVRYYVMSPFMTLYSGYIKEKPYVYYKGISSSQTPVTSFSAFTLPQDSQIDYKKNSDKVKLSVDVNFPNDGNTYAIRFVSSDNEFVSYDKTVMIKNGFNYSVSLLAYNAQGVLIGESSAQQLDLTKNDTFAPVIEFKDCYKYQHSANNRDGNSLNKGFVSSNYLELTTNIYDISSGKTPSYNIKALEYYFIPYGEITFSSMDGGIAAVPAERIIAASVKSGKIEKTTPFIENEKVLIPYDGLPSRYYYLYVVIKDNSNLCNSYSVLVDELAQVKHYITDIIPEVNYADSKLIIDLPLIYNAYIVAPGLVNRTKPDTSDYCFIKEQKVQNGKWIDITEPENGFDYLFIPPLYENEKLKNWRYEDSIDHDSQFIKINVRYKYSSDNGVFAKPLIVYPDYYKSLGTVNEIVCESKNILQGANGLQIYYDQAFLAHTMYCSQKITQTSGSEEAYEWLSNAQETGIEEHMGGSNSTYTYANSHYKDIPKGYYYTTIVHFADGDIAMSEIKQK